MNVQTKKNFSIMAALGLATIVILVIHMIPREREIRKEVDISVMGEEKPVKIASLNPGIATGENMETAYILGDKGSLYVLCCDSENYYAKLWHPEFWKGIKVVDLCAEEKKDTYALALDEEGNVYIWDKEYQYLGKESGWKRNDSWDIHRIENIPEVLDIYAGYNQFVLVTKEGEIYSWNPLHNVNPGIDDMEKSRIEDHVLNIVPLEEELLILDTDNVLWSIEERTEKVIKENVKNIARGGKGFVIQMMDDENEVYVYNIYLLQRGYETVTFADKYEVSKVSFESRVTSLAVSGVAAVACVDKETFYRWGRKERAYISTKLGYIVSLDDKAYEQPVEVDVNDARYYMLVGKDIVYADNQNRMFVLIQKP